MDLWAFLPQAPQKECLWWLERLRGGPGRLLMTHLDHWLRRTGLIWKQGLCGCGQEEVTLDGVGPRPLALSSQGEGR